MHATGAAAAFVAAAAAVLGIQSVRHRARRRGGRQPYRVRRTSFAVDHRSGSRGSPTQHVGTGAQAGRAARSSTSDGGGYGIATALEAQSSFTPPRFEWLSEHTAPAEPASDARSVEPLRPAACRWVTTAEEVSVTPMMRAPYPAADDAPSRTEPDLPLLLLRCLALRVVRSKRSRACWTPAACSASTRSTTTSGRSAGFCA